MLKGLAADRFESLVECHLPALVGYLARRLGRQVAEDLAAETIALAYRDRDRYDPSRGTEVAWLFAIATGLMAHHRRSERRRLAAFAEAQPSGSAEDATAGTAVDHVAAAETLRATARALRRMPARQRDALYLVAVAGLDYEDAAAALSVPVGTVRSRVSRARARLRGEIGLPDVSPDPVVERGTDD
jgi:RNA polymerase sigma-70 factor (ECF subfamily)